MKKVISYLVFYILQFSYGIIMNVIGLIVALFMLITFHVPHLYGPSIYFETKIMDGSGLELGMFFLVGTDADADLRFHEAGHGIQNIIFGPFFIFLWIAGIIRYWYLTLKYYRKGLDYDYEKAWWERQATRLGSKIYKNKESM